MPKSSAQKKNPIKISERKRKMKKHFMEDHNNGLTIAEIAKKYDLGKATVYNTLQEIADENDVSRDSLLQVLKTPSEKCYKEEEKRIQVDVKLLKEGFEKTKEHLDTLIGSIDDILKEEEHYDF